MRSAPSNLQMSTDVKQYGYHFRPAYGSPLLLIEIFRGADSDDFLTDFLDAVKEVNPIVTSVEDLWMNDEVMLDVQTNMGMFTLSKDTWGFAFLMADSNQPCLMTIDLLLQNDNRFEKIVIDFDKYK
jgi:hypothetical protein